MAVIFYEDRKEFHCNIVKMISGLAGRQQDKPTYQNDKRCMLNRQNTYLGNHFSG